ncbi:MAG: 2-amino-4-hydroxy-6-hydroxymethyldihydropteridine diphosphokinase [Bacteroidaceae bacterium]|nr:2-amino-4-hydroxy-6-hydroxymethyldihydropteridine diphosphokinase [Bacteroidaceae bacterium]
MRTLYVSLGSNIGEREKLIRRAVDLLSERIGVLQQLSTLRETQPWGFASDNLFLNAAASFSTALNPSEILSITEEVERELGRDHKTQHKAYTDRTIDIDLLALDDVVMQTEALTLPHPFMAERRFVLEPLCDIAAEALHPVSHLTYRELLRKLNRLDIMPVKAPSVEIVEALNRLLPQLTRHAMPMSLSQLQSLVANPSTLLLVGRDELQRICASLTLCFCSSPTGLKAWVEDVVVDATARGRGYATQLLDYAKAQAECLHAKSLNLTSQPQRQAANALYRKAGFAPRTTNVYRYELPSAKLPD